MPPVVALLLCLLTIVWALKMEARTGEALSGRFWIPFIWLLILGSRPLSIWLEVNAGGGGDALEGNAFDRNLYLALAIAALFILNQRGIRWGKVFRDNAWVLLFYGYLLLTCFWSDYPFVTFKRWFKELSAVPILLILFTYENPLKAIVSLFSKCAIIWIIVSVLFVKYYPDYGRIFSNSGGVQFVGVTTQKNTLGEIILVSVLVLLWGTFRQNSGRKVSGRWKERLPVILAVTTGLWLLQLCDSKTSMLALALGTFALFGNRLPILKSSRKVFLSVCFLALPLAFLLDQVTGLSALILEWLGRDPTLTGRTGIWDAVEQHPVNPLVGCGYLMYWDELGEVMINGYPTILKTAHNGYLDLYLDGGWLAILLLIPIIFITAAKIGKNYLRGSDFSKLQLAVFLALLLANFSESTLFRRSPLWFAFLLCCLDYSRAFAVPWTKAPVSGGRRRLQLSTDPHIAL